MIGERLLLERVLSLDEIALRVGYSSSSSFSAAFIRREGQAPGRYARQKAHA
ncbi:MULTISPECIES: helix-turn-helix domain-containing protein [Pseudomonas]|uniref:helix-turn-helix domain-containing protein n=1 Tax=Pseudomonas TaxID=286 RepID=UPI002D21DCF5|nr:helix-turn-helix domain-containing protein [Pseudomonas sp. LY10J]